MLKHGCEVRSLREERHISLGNVRFSMKISISSYKSSHVEAPVKNSPATSKSSIGYLKLNIFQFHICSVLGQRSRTSIPNS